VKQIWMWMAAGWVAAQGLTAAGQPAGDLALDVRGTVAETLSGGRYSYINVDTGTGRLWVACYQVDARTGDPVRVSEGRAMANFTSPTLNRTFEAIVFASRVQVGTNPPAGNRKMPAGHPPVGADAAGAMDGTTGGLVRGEVLETMDAGAYTYVQVKTAAGTEWAAGSRFAVAKGDRVVMSSGMIMRNFESPTLNRTFDALRVVESIRVDDGQAAPPRAARPPGHP
jgi:hypothetical protein